MPTPTPQLPPEKIDEAAVEQTLPDFFEIIAHTHPHQPALLGGTWNATYAELNHAANAIAQQILATTGNPGDRIAILMRHDTPLIAAIIAALKVGRVVVVLNTTDPPARLSQVLTDSAPSLILNDIANQPRAKQLATDHATKLLCIDSLTHHPAPPVHTPRSPHDFAFLIYTSGTTGRPKGVIQTHRNIIHNMFRNARGLAIHAADRLVLLASPSGGQGLGAMWCALLTGAALCPFPASEKGLTGLADWLNHHRITLYISAASVFRHFMQTLPPEARFPHIRTVRLASEPANAEDFSLFVRHFHDSCALLHTLSSSETGNITQSLLAKTSHVNAGKLPVGRPVPGIEILLLDPQGQPVPHGNIGEVVVRSAYLSPGYWQNSELTAQKFSTDPASSSLRLYRSGDRAHLAPDGTLVFTGRVDDQIKIHGFRVEITDIENALAALPSVHSAAVCVTTPPHAEAAIHAFITLHPHADPSPESLRQTLRQTLPPYMVPSHFHILDALPLSTQGKIDRIQLRALAQSHLDSPLTPASNNPPATPTEKILAEIWRSVLKQPSLHRASDFFSAGGDSLYAAVIAAKLHATTGHALDLAIFTQHSTLSALAAHLDSLAPHSPSQTSIPLLPQGSHLPLSFSQERIWRYSRTPQASAGYTVACSHLLRGPLNPAALESAIHQLILRHEMLRTTFTQTANQPTQHIHPPAPFTLPLLDFSADPNPEKRAEEFFRTQAVKPFDLATPPLLRFFLIKIRPNEHWLLRIYHHILADAWSWSLFFREMSALYESLLSSHPAPLPPLPLRYADYAAWQRATLDPAGPAYQQTLDWWQHTLSPPPPTLKLPFRRWLRSPRAKAHDGFLWWGIDPSTSQKLDALAKQHAATYYMIRLAAFLALLAHQTQSSDLAIGTYVTNRTRVETQSLFGFFANLATLRIRCQLHRPFLDFLSEVRTAVAGIQSHAEIPYESLAEALRARNLAPPPIRAVFSLSDHTADLPMNDVTFSRLDRLMETMPWGFTLNWDVHHETSRNYAAFDARIYHPRRVHAFIDRYRLLLDNIALHPDKTLDSLLR